MREILCQHHVDEIDSSLTRRLTPMDPEVRHLQLVAAVADMGSLTRAGDRLHLTQSALRPQLRGIPSRGGGARRAPRAASVARRPTAPPRPAWGGSDSRLGAALFRRVGKRLVLTPAGERLLV